MSHSAGRGEGEVGSRLKSLNFTKKFENSLP